MTTPRETGATITVTIRDAGAHRTADVRLLPAPWTEGLAVPLAVWEIRPSQTFRPDAPWTVRYLPSEPGLTSYTSEHAGFSLALSVALADASTDLAVYLDRQAAPLAL